jgi:esterase
MELNFETAGSGDPLVILHGLFGSLDNWGMITRLLAREWQVFAVDQRNHGRSPHSEQMNYPEMAKDLLEFIRQREIAAADLLGHSMGGKTAMQFALEFPAHVRKLVVADIAPRAYAPRHLQILNAMAKLQLSRYQTREQIDVALAASIDDKAVRQFLLKSVTRREQGFDWKINVPALLANYARLTEAVTTGMFEGPTLFILGEHSDYVTVQDRKTILDQFPAAEFHVVPGTGHWLHAEAPDQFATAVAQFLH